VFNRIALYLPVFLLAGASILAAQTKPPEVAPGEKSHEAPKTMPDTVGKDTTGAAIDPHTYVIGVEDVLYISVFREAELSRAVSVRPDGKITMPLVGDLQAEGLTPERFGAQLKQALTTFINSPDVTITVAQVNSKRYTISGEVLRAGVFPLVTPIRVFDALSLAGFKDFANPNKTVIIRGSQRIHFNYHDVLKGKKLETNIFLEPGDTIHVP
jgi:polysaccharide export outer membrane protein